MTRADFRALKTVSVGDESAERPNRAASIIPVITIFLSWGFHRLQPDADPRNGPFMGETTYTETDPLP